MLLRKRVPDEWVESEMEDYDSIRNKPSDRVIPVSFEKAAVVLSLGMVTVSLVVAIEIEMQQQLERPISDGVSRNDASHHSWKLRKIFVALQTFVSYF